jgi:hypothetical protein
MSKTLFRCLIQRLTILFFIFLFFFYFFYFSVSFKRLAILFFLTDKFIVCICSLLSYDLNLLCYLEYAFGVCAPKQRYFSKKLDYVGVVKREQPQFLRKEKKEKKGRTLRNSFRLNGLLQPGNFTERVTPQRFKNIVKTQGCKMVYIFSYQNTNLGIFRRPLQWKLLLYLCYGHYV